MFVQAFAFGPYHLFYIPKIHDVPVRRNLMRPELQPNLVVVPVQLFTKSFVGDKMRGIEFEIVLGGFSRARASGPKNEPSSSPESTVYLCIRFFLSLN